MENPNITWTIWRYPSFTKPQCKERGFNWENGDATRVDGSGLSKTNPLTLVGLCSLGWLNPDDKVADALAEL